jgi:uncharacterized Zn-binding protein involved in type VI secretion
MGKPAARLLDMTAHGGMITGPGCPTVLIGKMPAARMTDMHVCPMLTGVVPHAGGPLVGPVPPTVFIGKLPAACMGDMAICVGPPATVLPPGSPTVLIGSSGGGGGGGGGSGATAAQAGQTQSATAPTSIEGTEAFPIEIQQQLAEAAQYQTPDEIALLVKLIDDALEQGSGGDADESETAELTLADIVEILEQIESEESYEAARHFASYLDYSTLTAMAMSGTEGNDPNQMPTRFMLLWGADDSTLASIDDHPDNFEDAPEHKVTVANLRKALRLLGHDIAEEGPYDNEVLRAHSSYIATAWGQCDATSEEGYVVEEGESMGEIAERFGLASWKYLYELNKDAIGDNPDLLRPGAQLTIPAWNHTSGEEKIAEKGAKVFRYVGGVRYAYPWVPFSVTLVDRKGEVLRERNAQGEMSEEFAVEKEFVIRDKDRDVELVRGSLSRSDALEVLVPDSRSLFLEVDGVAYA